MRIVFTSHRKKFLFLININNKIMEKLNKILEWQKNKPKNNKQWADDVKQENLDVKFDYQLKEMEKSHQDKIPKVQKDLDKFDNWSDAVKYELTEQFEQMFKDAKIETDKKLEGKALQEWIDEDNPLRQAVEAQADVMKDFLDAEGISIVLSSLAIIFNTVLWYCLLALSVLRSIGIFFF